MKLRAYQPQDWDSFIELDLETILAGMHTASEQERQSVRDRWPDLARSLYQWTERGPTTQESELYVLEGDAGDYAGHLWLSRHDDFFSKARHLHVTAVAVAPQYRSRGYGRQLMEHAIELAHARGLPMALSVAAENERALGLYRKLGFVPTRLSMTRPADARPEAPTSG